MRLGIARGRAQGSRNTTRLESHEAVQTSRLERRPELLRCRPSSENLDIGRLVAGPVLSALAPLRGEGVLIMGSGNIVHNLRHAFTAWRQGATATPDWARSFDEEVARAVAGRETTALARALDSDVGRLAHPTPDH